MSFLPPLEMSPSSIAPNPVESREAPPNCTVSLTSQWHQQKLTDVTGKSRGNPGLPATPEKGLESLSSTRLEVRFPYHDSRAMTRSP